MLCKFFCFVEGFGFDILKNGTFLCANLSPIFVILKPRKCGFGTFFQIQKSLSPFQNQV
jgi:hypothetical protein